MLISGQDYFKWHCEEVAIAPVPANSNMRQSGQLNIERCSTNLDLYFIAWKSLKENKLFPNVSLST